MIALYRRMVYIRIYRVNSEDSYVCVFIIYSFLWRLRGSSTIAPDTRAAQFQPKSINVKTL